MKIHIELEVAPDEVPLATELLAVLRWGDMCPPLQSLRTHRN